MQNKVPHMSVPKVGKQWLSNATGWHSQRFHVRAHWSGCRRVSALRTYAMRMRPGVTLALPQGGLWPCSAARP